VAKIVAKVDYVRARVTPRMKQAVVAKAESLEKSESEIVIRLLEKWLKNEIEI